LKPKIKRITPNANMASPIVFMPNSQPKIVSGIGDFTACPAHGITGTTLDC
jgi:hypothetical protein